MFGRQPSEAQFRTLFEASPNGVMTVDTAGRITLVNGQAERMFGYNHRELVGKPVEILVPQQFRDRHVFLRKRAAADLRVRPMGTDRVFPAVRKDGTEFPVEVGINHVLATTGQMIVVTVVDVTERRSRSQRLWHFQTIAGIIFVLGFVAATALIPLGQHVPKTIFPFAPEQPVDGVEAAFTAYRKGSYAAALQLARPGAERGDSRAQSLLGLIYLSGQGVERNQPEAIKWYQRAADQGDADAQLKIGDMYFDGTGLPQDYSEAGRWYRLAADHGNADAQYNLGILYARGVGVPTDNILSHMWFNLAAARFTTTASRDRAIANREAIAKKLSIDQVARAQQLARDWKINP